MTIFQILKLFQSRIGIQKVHNVPIPILSFFKPNLQPNLRLLSFQKQLQRVIYLKMVYDKNIII